MRPFHELRNPTNLMDPFRIHFHTIHKFFPQYKDDDEIDYHRTITQRR